MNDSRLRHTPARSYRHPLQIGPLVYGLVFLGVTAVWALWEAGAVDGSDAGWLLPAVLVGAGALGVLLGTLRPRRTGATDDELMAQVPPPDVTPRAGDDTAGAAAHSHRLDTPDHDAHDETAKREPHDD